MSTSCRKRPVTWFAITTMLVVAACGVVLTGKVKPPPPPPTPIIATTTDRNFLEVDVDKVACQTEFDLAMDISGDGTHYRYKVGPAGSTNPGVLTGYSAPISKTIPVSFNLASQAVGDYVLCLQALTLDRKGRITASQPLDQATAYYWEKDTPPVEFHVTFTGSLGGRNTMIYAINPSGTAVGRAASPEGTNHAIRWTANTGLEDISSLVAPWFDFDTGSFVEGYIACGAFDINAAGQIVGNAYDGVTLRAFFYDPFSGFWLLPTLDEGDYRADSINHNGEVLGNYRTADLSISKNFFWTPLAPNDLTLIETDVSVWAMSEGIGNDVFKIANGGETNMTQYLYSFVYANGALWYELADTVHTTFVPSCRSMSCINNSGAFAFVGGDQSAPFVRLYQTPQQSILVSSSANNVAFKINNSNDFVYAVDFIPYLYRYSENRSYRLYDVADSDTKSTLFASSAGDVKNSPYGMSYMVNSDDNFAGTPTNNPFDTVSGLVYDPTHDAMAAFVLTPVPKL